MQVTLRAEGKRRVIRLPNGRAVSLATYVAAWRTLKGTDAAALVRGWDHFPTQAGVVLGAIQRGLHDRINLRGGAVVCEGRVHPATWGKARTPRVVLERHDVQAMNRSARRAIGHREREARS